MATQSATSRRRSLFQRVQCPHCWGSFRPEEILWMSEHQDLLGDPRLGADHQQRFLATRFNLAGDALDGKGFACQHLACPHCHLVVPRVFLELEPLFLSIFGAPASGKSYFLAAMSWELRKVAPLNFRVSFSDADPALNRILNDYEESLFSSSRPEELVPLARLIRKTEEQGELYDMVSFGNQTVNYPRPMVFTMQPQRGHPYFSRANALGRAVCLYDNAGESFLPGRDTAANPVTRHMAHSRALFFVFDPTQEARFRRKCEERLGPSGSDRLSRQEPFLQEAAARIRRHTGLKQTERHSRPLIVILTKCDAWSHLLSDEPLPDPWRKVSSGVVGDRPVDAAVDALDLEVIDRRSMLVRKLLLEHCPEIVTAAEGFANDVTYIPVSAVGWQTRVDGTTGLLSIRPGDAAPYWAAVPYLYALCRWTPGLVPGISRRKKPAGANGLAENA
jgi:hypothetical protein